jgi:hypothetical protein
MTITGKVTHVLPEQTGTSKAGKDWSKAGFVVEVPGEYPKSVAIETFGDKVTLPQVGQDVTVSVNIESREWNGKWFTNVTAWKIDANGASEEAPVEDDLESTPLPF